MPCAAQRTEPRSRRGRVPRRVYSVSKSLLCSPGTQRRSRERALLPARQAHVYNRLSEYTIRLWGRVGNIVLYSPRCSESRCGPECGGVTRVSSEIGVVVCHTCLWTLRDFIRLAPEIGVKHVFVHWRIGRILQRVGRTQKDVLVHPLLSKYNYNVGDQAR